MIQKIVLAYEYLFYRIYATYKYRWHDNMPGMYALGIVALLQLFLLDILLTMLPVLFWGIDFLSFHNGMNKWELGTTTVAPMYILNYLYFYKCTSFEKLEERWKDEPEDQKRRRGRIVLFFIIAVFVFSVGLAAYVGETRNR